MGSDSQVAPKPLSLYLDYTLITDDTGRKGHGLGHQFNISPELNLKQYGRLGGLVWMEFFDAPLREAETDEGALLELDWGPYWALDIAPLRATAQLGWVGENFPRQSGDARFTQEVYVAFSFDDSRWFKRDRPVFSPFIAYYQDLDENPGGWIDLGISHTYFLAELGFEKSSFLKYVSITPSLLVGVDMGQLDNYWDVATVRMGFDVCYDLGGILKWPAKAGRPSLTTFVYYRDSRIEGFDDRWYGGMMLSYGW